MRFYKYTPEVIGGLFLDSLDYQGLFWIYEDLIKYNEKIDKITKGK